MKILFNDGYTRECPAEEVEVLHHSAAHIMAQAVKRLYPHILVMVPLQKKAFIMTSISGKLL